MNITWVLVAIIFFVLSKILTALRLNLFFKNIGIHISELENFKLYAIGMFYNLFLPGGIGGDGYKVYLLNKHFQTPIKPLIQASLLDRLGGLIAILFLLIGLYFFIEIDLSILSSIPLDWVATASILVLYPIFYLSNKLLFAKFIKSFTPANIYSILGQVAQMISAYFILLALGVNEKFLAYQFVFLLSSIVAVLPLTIGGVGARELVFIYSHEYIGIDKNTAVAFSLMFFLISAITSLSGAFIKTNIETEEN